MPNVVANAGGELNSTYQIGDFQGVFGLILESWGPSSRNADYNEALEVILGRLQHMDLGEIGVNVISRDLVDLQESFTERAIVLDSSTSVSLRGRGARNIRLEIGRAQAHLKADPSRTGGNRTKRILLHSARLTSADWSSIAAPVTGHSPDTWRQSNLHIPAGTESPKSFSQMTTVIERDASVRAWILRGAAGICELCGRPAPFLTSDGDSFLEVHHVIALANGGPDTITNAVALCPNCHRELHYGAKRLFKQQHLYGQIPRLIKVYLTNAASSETN